MLQSNSKIVSVGRSAHSLMLKFWLACYKPIYEFQGFLG